MNPSSFFLDNFTLTATGVADVWEGKVVNDRGKLIEVLLRADVVAADGDLIATEAHRLVCVVQNLDGTVTGAVTTVSVPNNTASGLTFAVAATGTLARVTATANATATRRVLLTVGSLEI